MNRLDAWKAVFACVRGWILTKEEVVLFAFMSKASAIKGRSHSISIIPGVFGVLPNHTS